MMGLQSIFATGVLTKLGPATTIVGSAATLVAGGGFFGGGITGTVARGVYLGNNASKMVGQAEAYAGMPQNTIRAIKSISPGAMAYGKRGIDSNRLATNGLVQSLHKGRRSS